MEGSGRVGAGVQPAQQKFIWYRRVSGPEAAGGLGKKDRSAGDTDPAGKRYHGHAYLDGYLSLCSHICFRLASVISQSRQACRKKICRVAEAAEEKTKTAERSSRY